MRLSMHFLLTQGQVLESWLTALNSFLPFQGSALVQVCKNRYLPSWPSRLTGSNTFPLLSSLALYWLTQPVHISQSVSLLWKQLCPRCWKGAAYPSAGNPSKAIRFGRKVHDFCLVCSPGQVNWEVIPPLELKISLVTDKGPYLDAFLDPEWKPPPHQSLGCTGAPKTHIWGWHPQVETGYCLRTPLQFLKLTSSPKPASAPSEEMRPRDSKTWCLRRWIKMGKIPSELCRTLGEGKEKQPPRGAPKGTSG